MQVNIYSVKAFFNEGKMSTKYTWLSLDGWSAKVAGWRPEYHINLNVSLLMSPLVLMNHSSGKSQVFLIL